MYGRGGPAVGSRQTGTVKSWNASNGYGFIECPGMAGDIMFLRSGLPPDCKEVRGKFLDRKQVEFEVQAGNAGKMQAANLTINVGEGDYLAGRIKTFSDQNGYGFIESSMLPGVDVRVGRDNFDALLPGANLKEQLVVFQMQVTPEGRHRATKAMFQSSKIAQHLKADMGGMAGKAAGAGVCPYYAHGKCQKGVDCKWSHAAGGGLVGGHFGMGAQMGQGGLKRGAAGMEGTQMCPFFAKGTCHKGSECKWSHAPGLTSNSNNDGGGGGAGSGEKVCPYFAKGTCQMGAGCKWSHGGGSAVASNGSFKKPKIESYATGQRSSGIIKSYNASKGFGFIEARDVPADVFFMKSDLPVEARDEDIKGCGVNFEIMSTPDGKLRANNITSC